MSDLNRRDFLAKSTVAAGALAPAIATRGFGNANDRIRVAVVGIRGQGGAHIRAYSTLPGCELAALCDVDESQLSRRLKELEEKRIRPSTYTDIRRLLDDKSIDAISIATPNHWHALATVWGCQAGKDVYVEKPCTYNLYEGSRLIEAARKYKRIVQHGSNNRSASAVREGMQKLREGVIGDVYMARGLCFKWRPSIDRKPDTTVPAGVHYDLWLGPAPKRAFNENRFHYNWHWNWDYGNGDIGNQGIHQLDLARWGLGVRMPTKVSSMGGHFMFDDDQETPNTQTATYEFVEGGRKKFLVFDVRHWISNREAGIGQGQRDGIGNMFYGSEGYMVISGRGYQTFLGKEQTPGPSGKGEGNHWENFLNAVRSRKTEDLHAPIEEGVLSCVLIHLANISYRTGRTINFDPATQRIVGDDEANRLMGRKYREPYVVPEKV